MWALRVLNGTHAGQVFKLREGKNRFGRGNSVDFQIQSSGVSKEHLEITVIGEKILFNDLNSANGTFLNGVRAKGGILKLGDKISLHEVLCDIVIAAEKPVVLTTQKTKSTISTKKAEHPVPYHAQNSGSSHPLPMAHMSAMPSQPGLDVNNQQPPEHLKKTIFQKANEYLEQIVLPSVYKFTENHEFRYVLMGFVLFYVLLVTVLSVVPMKQITSESILNESKRRALTVARSLSRGNERVLRTGDFSNFSTDFVLKEEGVDDVYVISKEGRILAPPERVGNTPKEIGFYKEIRGKTREHCSELGSKIAAAVPILGYDAELQQNTAKAYAIVIYNPGSLSFDEGRALSLFVQMLVIAFVLGAVLFYFMFKVIEYPFLKLNQELDSALREGRDHAQLKVHFPVLHILMTNINSLLARALHSSGPSSSSVEAGKGSKNSEYFNLLSLVGFPGLIVSTEGIILKCNAAFENMLGFSGTSLENSKVNQLSDQALQKNIEDLIQQSNQNHSVIAIDKLEFSGHMFKLSCQAMTLNSGDVDCYFVTISPLEDAEGNVA